MIRSFTSILSENNINVVNMVNKSKGEYAYTMIDLGSPVTEDILEKIRAVEGVLRASIIC